MIETSPIDRYRLDVSPEDLLISQKRILSLKKTINLFTDKVRENYLIALTTGSFDLIHAGHIRYIEDLVRIAGIRSKEVCKNPLVAIGINSDLSTQRNREERAKGRPVFTEKYRAEVVAGFKGVNLVFIFDNDLDLVKLSPNIFQVFTLSDHAPETRPEVLVMRRNGTEIVTIHDDNRPDSTSNILNRIHSKNIT